MTIVACPRCGSISIAAEKENGACLAWCRECGLESVNYAETIKEALSEFCAMPEDFYIETCRVCGEMPRMVRICDNSTDGDWHIECTCGWVYYGETRAKTIETWNKVMG